LQIATPSGSNFQMVNKPGKIWNQAKHSLNGIHDTLSFGSQTGFVSFAAIKLTQPSQHSPSAREFDIYVPG